MRLRRWITVSGAAMIVALVAGCTAPDPEAANSGTADAPSSVVSSSAGANSDSSDPVTAEDGASEESDQEREAAAAGTAAAALETLAVKGRAPKTGYDREMFGPAWADIDHNGCDTRNDILARDLVNETFKPGTQDCVVLSGVLNDPFTATEIHFLRGQDTSTKVQIDHVVALSDAWQKGAQQLDPTKRAEFANDPLNLLAVDGPSNSQKGDGDAATWLPANRSFRCEYVARQITVKARYDLWVTSAERDAMAETLTTCPGQPLPTAQTADPVQAAPADQPVVPVAPASVGEPEVPASQAEVPQVDVPQPAATDPQFSSCAKAKAAGYGPYSAGSDPEYHWYGDGDNDGINCE